MHCKATSLLTNSIFDPNSHQPAYAGVRRGGKAYDLRRLRRIRRQLIPSKRCERNLGSPLIEICRCPGSRLTRPGLLPGA